MQNLDGLQGSRLGLQGSQQTHLRPGPLQVSQQSAPQRETQEEQGEKRVFHNM